jgi:hypothetical protein
MSCPGNWVGDSCPACELLTAPDGLATFSVIDADTGKSVQISIVNRAYEEFLQIALGKVRREP